MGGTFFVIATRITESQRLQPKRPPCGVRCPKEWMDVAFGAEDIDQRDLLFQCVARLERTARKAEESGQFAVVVGCVAQLNKMMALGADQKGFRSHSSHHYRR